MTAHPHAGSDTLPAPVKCPACGTPNEPLLLQCETCGSLLRTSGLRSPGTVIGSYRLIDVIGEGGMGVVYLAEHTKLGRRVAIKMLRTEYGSNPQAVQRFFAEARAVNKISHQNIVEITDFVENPGADNYYIMELLIGSNLAKQIDGQPVMAPARAVGIMAQVARALEAVHEAGIVHRDLKPDNVFLIERSGQKDFVKLLDFGVAKLGELGDGIALHRTAAGAILGTPEYMSPEQASGKTVDYRTDLYSFGVLLYELVTGRLPLTGSSFGELVVKHLTVAPPLPSKIAGLPHVIPPSLEDLILACLAKDPLDRPDTIRTVLTRLEAIAQDEGWDLVTFTDAVPRVTGRMAVMPALHKPRPTPEYGEADVTMPTRIPPKRRTALWIGGAAALVVGLGLAAMKLAGSSSEPAAPPPERAQPVARIDVAFETTPAGAEVFRAGETVALGRTPFSTSFDMSDRIETFELRLAGYTSTTQKLRLDRSSRVSAALVAVAPSPVVEAPVVKSPETKPVRTAAKPKKVEAKAPVPTTKKTDPKPNPDPRPGDRSGVMNPFAN